MALEVHRASYGRLILDHADKVAREFFAADISSVDWLHESYDERATGSSTDQYEEADTTAIRRGMGLGRAPGHLWTWIREEAPMRLLRPIPRDLDLIDATKSDVARVRPVVEVALAGFVAQGSGEWRRLAVATKVLALKRPRLVPILDNNVLTVLGLPLSGDAGHSEQVERGMEAIDLLRREGSRNRSQLREIQRLLVTDGGWRSKIRILDGLLWKAY